ncbi:MAG: hypothetical protein JWO74_1196 [Solirubrobacterales bacterium]|jgi:hypothetical protein|nr:hypothetical protein [Solirubrobacterales bacterium]
MTAAHEPSPDGYAVVDPNRVENLHEETDIPGEFRQLTEALASSR